MSDLKLYIAVLDEVPDFIVPTLVAHTVLNAHIDFSMLNEHMIPNQRRLYDVWLNASFKKCVIRVNRKEFAKIAAIPNTYLGHENKTLGGEKSCAIPVPVYNDDLPNVLKFAKLWAPKQTGE
jgi:hypothetical protein